MLVDLKQADCKSAFSPRGGSSLELSLSSGLLAPYPKPSRFFFQALPVPQQLQGNQRGRRGR